jgi:poly [ADP-ribose] polymerase
MAEVEAVAAKTGQKASLLYNEFIVYDTARVRMRYLVKVKFNYNQTNRY